jgi:hypothetical protein
MLLLHVDVVAMTRDPSLIKIVCYCPTLHHVLFLDFVCLMFLLFIYVWTVYTYKLIRHVESDQYSKVESKLFNRELRYNKVTMIDVLWKYIYSLAPNFCGFCEMHWSMASWIRGFQHYRNQSMEVALNTINQINQIKSMVNIDPWVYCYNWIVLMCL